MKLRPYQEEARDNLVTALLDDGHNRVVAVGPTGCGKTVIAGATLKTLMDRGVRRPLFLVHTDELVTQSAGTLRAMIPGASIGIVKGTQNNTRADITIGSRQTLQNEKRRNALTGIGALFIDECHHASAQSYVDIMTHYGSFIATPTCGLTATLMRADDKHLGDVWSKVVFRRDILWMIREGYLCDVKGYTVDVDDLDMPSARGGDYSNAPLGQAIIDSSAGEQVVKAWREHAEDRPTVLFAPTVDAAQMFTDVFSNSGITAECVTGETDSVERRAIYKRVERGTTKILCNCMVLTEGFDLPPLSCCIIARPTQSQGLYIQMVGRVLRTFPGKADAIVLDVAGISTQHSLCGLSVLTTSSKRKTVEPGESIAEASARWEAECDGYWDDTDQPAPGPLVLTEVDLFARSRAAWQQARGGHWFVSTSARVWFLREQTDGLYAVWCTSNPYRLKPAKEVATDLTIDLAMDHAEGLAMDEDSSVAGKDASWRKGNRSASPAQVRYARTLGIDPGGLCKRELSAAIDIAKANKMGL